MVRKVDKTKLLTVVGIIIFLFGGAVRIFSHLTSSADNYIENFDVIVFSGLIIGWGVSVAYRIVQKNIRICLVISAALMLLWMALRAIKYNSPADINTYGRYLWYSYYIAKRNVHAEQYGLSAERNAYAEQHSKSASFTAVYSAKCCGNCLLGLRI